MRIEIAGALATGKSTLAGLLEKSGFHIVCEDLESNPYLELRKQDPERYDLLCQQRFVSDKVEALARAVKMGESRIVSDYCLDVDKAYVSYYLSGKPEWVADLERQIDEGTRAIGRADAIVFLHCRPETQLGWIRQRGRSFEQGHDLAFIERIDAMVAQRIEVARASGIRIIDVDVDDCPSEVVSRRICALFSDPRDLSGLAV